MSEHRRLESRGGAVGRAPFFLAVSSGSRFRVTVTTLRMRWFPPWRIMLTTCRWPTLTTFSLFTCGKTGAVGEGPRGPKGTAPTPRQRQPCLPMDGRTCGQQADSTKLLWFWNRRCFWGTSGRLLWGCRSPDHSRGARRAVQGGFQLQGDQD